jgi:hypothetical protein
MARTVNVIVTDDLDESEGAGRIRIDFRGISYEIDLTPAHKAKFAESIAPFTQAARRYGSTQTARTAAQQRNQSAIRSWAREQGLDVSDRGRMPTSVIVRYNAAH